jgi:hypothetical protein
MSTRLLYHAFGMRGYDCVRTDYDEAQVIGAQAGQSCRDGEILGYPEARQQRFP